VSDEKGRAIGRDLVGDPLWPRPPVMARRWVTVEWCDLDHDCRRWDYCAFRDQRVLDPDSYVLVEKVDGRWPMTDRVFNAIEDALVRETGSASMRTIETVVETYLDALAGGEQP